MKQGQPPFQWDPNVPIIVGRNTLEKLASGGSRAIDIFLLPEIRLIRNEYKRSGNPYIVYLAANSVANIVKPFKGSHSSFQYSQLLALMGELALAQGSHADIIHVAIYHIESAIEIVNQVDSFCNEIIAAEVNYCLLLAVAEKVLGNHGESLSYLHAVIKHLAAKRYASELDLVPLRRQEIMMHQTIGGHRQLAEDAVQFHRLNPLEYYRSIKRVFEFLLNTGGMHEAEQIYPELKRAFTAVSFSVDPISHVSFLKNIGQYMLLRNETEQASMVLGRTLLDARRLNLQGQVRQVTHLLQELDSGNNQGKLETFIV